MFHTDTSSSSEGSDATQYSEMVLYIYIYTAFASTGGIDTAETESEAFQWKRLSHNKHCDSPVLGDKLEQMTEAYFREEQ